MNAAFPILAMTAALAAFPAQAAQIVPTSERPVVELSVTETVDSTPDTATFGTGVTTKAPTAKEALRANSATMNKLVAAIRKLGVAEKDIQTTGINLNAEYDYSDGQNPRFVGYQVTNQVSLKVRDLAKLGDMMDALVSDGGANNLYGPTFSIDDPTSVKVQARERALVKARAQAMEYAKMAGFNNVQLLAVQESIDGNSTYADGAAREMVKSASMSPPVAPGQVGTSVTVQVAYEMTR